jgi:hypothetical protein
VLQVKVLLVLEQVKVLQVKVLQVKVLQVQGMTMALRNIHQMCCSSNIHMIDT